MTREATIDAPSTTSGRPIDCSEFGTTSGSEYQGQGPNLDLTWEDRALVQRSLGYIFRSGLVMSQYEKLFANLDGRNHLIVGLYSICFLESVHLTPDDTPRAADRC